MAGVRVVMSSFPGGQATPTVYDDSITYANTAAAISAIASGWLPIAPDGTTEVVQLSVAHIVAILPKN